MAFEESGDENILLLNNGCLCCTVRGDLVDMLGKLVNDRKGQFDHILIETTGLANPAPIIQTFYLEPDLLDSLRLDGVVTLIDSKHAMLHLDEEKPEGVVNEALEQVAFADRLVVNKTDLVEEAQIRTVENRVRTINQLATIQRSSTRRWTSTLSSIIGGFDLDRVQDVIEQEPEAHSHSHSHDHDHSRDAEGECEDPECNDPSHSHSHSHSHDHGHAQDDAECEVRRARPQPQPP